MRPNLPRDPEKIAVFRALNLGDLLCAVPALRALRAGYPAAHITLIGLPAMADFARRFPKYIDAFTSFPGIPGLPEQSFVSHAFVDFLQRERQAAYDLVIQMHGNGGITNSLTSMLGARNCAGYYQPGAFCPDPLRFMPYPDGIPEVRRHMKLMNFLGLDAKGEALEFPITPDDWRRLDALAIRHGFDDGDYVCIHAGARDERRWWAPDKFAQVADLLSTRGNTVVFTGTADERETVNRVREKMANPSVNLAGETDLGVLGALIGRARLLVSNDTGVSHLAAALGTQSVVIFLASDPRRWAPLDRQRHRVVRSSAFNDVGDVLFHVEHALLDSPVPGPAAPRHLTAQSQAKRNV